MSVETPPDPKSSQEVDGIDEVLPAVAYPERSFGLIAGVVGVLALGGLVFMTLLAGQNREDVGGVTPTRSAVNDTGLGAPIPAAPDLFAQAPVDPFATQPAPVPVVPAGEPPQTGTPYWQTSPPPPPPPISPPPPPPPPPSPIVARVQEFRDNLFPPAPTTPPPAPPAVRPAADLGQRMRSPALIIDLSTPTPAGGEGAPTPAQMAAAGGSDNDSFAARVAGTETPAARAGALRNPKATVPQGAMISAVLETAINSDLPGFVRAVVSRDVTGFDGTRVLIPRGSRLVGQYRSEVALGQSRAFVVWTRLMRPDGVSVQLASPGTDTLGRAGLDGQVNRHYLQRYGPSLLTTAISAALSGSNRSNQLVIGTAQTAASAATTGEAIKPTVTVAQGTAIQVFVARDLDFSTVSGPRTP